MAIQLVMPGIAQTVVELSQSVIDAAPCFGVGADGTNYDIVHAEGRGYLEAAGDMAYDAVLVDVADGSDRLPACFSTIEFFKTVLRVLKPHGVLAMNVHTGRTLHNDLTDLLPGAFQVFADVKIGRAPGLANAIVLVQMRGNTTTEDDSSTEAHLQAWYADAEFTDAANSTSKEAGSARTDSQYGC
jgi:spermidine synthase